MFCTCLNKRDGYSVRGDGVCVHAGCQRPSRAHYMAVIARQHSEGQTPSENVTTTQEEKSMSEQTQASPAPAPAAAKAGRRALPVSPDSAPTGAGKRALPAPASAAPSVVAGARKRLTPVEAAQMIDLTRLSTAQKGALMEETLRLHLAAGAPARRQAVALEAMTKAEQDRELLTQEQARRAAGSALPAFALPTGLFMPSLDLAEVSMFDVVPEQVRGRYVSACRLVGLAEPADVLVYAAVGGLHTAIGLAAGELVRAERKAKAAQAHSEQVPTRVEDGAASEQSAKQPKAKAKKAKAQAAPMVLADLKPKKRAKALALIEVMGWDEQRAVTYVTTPETTPETTPAQTTQV